VQTPTVTGPAAPDFNAPAPAFAVADQSEAIDTRLPHTAFRSIAPLTLSVARATSPAAMVPIVQSSTSLFLFTWRNAMLPTLGGDAVVLAQATVPPCAEALVTAWQALASSSTVHAPDCPAVTGSGPVSRVIRSWTPSHAGGAARLNVGPPAPGPVGAALSWQPASAASASGQRSGNLRGPLSTGCIVIPRKD